MTYLFRGLGDTPNELIPTRNGRALNAPMLPKDSELRASAVWAALRLRANLISTLPLKVYKMRDGRQITADATPVILSPGALFLGGQLSPIDEWLYATQMDLDRFGNAFGIIVARDAAMRPARIDLVPADQVTVRVHKGELSYKIAGEKFSPFEVWHERQYVAAGLPVGLSPVAYSALTLGQYTNSQQFASEWFTNGAIPSAKMKNTAKTLTDEQAANMKRRVKATQAAGDVLVLGSDWDYEMVAVPPAQTQFLEAQQASLGDLARFYDVPGDVIEVSQSGASVTYANITQRNMQLLIMNLAPAIIRRERMLTSLLPSPRAVLLDTDALLRMDPLTTAEVLATKLKGRALDPNEWREMDNRPPLTPEQIALFKELFPLERDAKKETL